MRTGKSEELTKLIGRRLKEMLGADEASAESMSAAIQRGLQALSRLEHGSVAFPSQSPCEGDAAALHGDNFDASKIDIP